MKEIIKDIGLRALKTFLESFLAFITIGGLITEIDWTTALSVSLTATLYTVIVNTVSNINKFIDKDADAQIDDEDMEE